MSLKNPIRVVRPPVTPSHRRRKPKRADDSLRPWLIAFLCLGFAALLVLVKIKTASSPAPEVRSVEAGEKAPVALAAGARSEPLPPGKTNLRPLPEPRQEAAEKAPPESSGIAVNQHAPMHPQAAPEADLAIPAAAAPEDAEKLFTEFRQEELLKLPSPVLGSEIEIHYSNGDVMRQTPVAVDDSRGLVRIKMEYGSAEVHYSSLSRPCAETYLPRLKAERLARARVSKKLAGYIAASKAARGASREEMEGMPPSDAPSSFLPTPSKTPEELLQPEEEMRAYLNMQERRNGQRFAVIRSKFAGEGAVLFLEVGEGFGLQNPGIRYQVTEGLRQFWGLRCMSNGVATDDKAFLVLLSKGRIVGGSRSDNATAIWIR
ncbi:MAG: hypothetical protein RL095_1020 [Verrucomicrobiota bacterium]|jgi:hypothetical protein